MGKRRRYRNRGRRKAEAKRRGALVCYFHGHPVYAGDLANRALWMPVSIRLSGMGPGESPVVQFEMVPTP